MIQLKRVYDKPEAKDGFRILVDRLWPRGLTKIRAKADLWLKEIAPSIAQVTLLFNTQAAPFIESYSNPFKAAATSLGGGKKPVPIFGAAPAPLIKRESAFTVTLPPLPALNVFELICPPPVSVRLRPCPGSPVPLRRSRRTVA